MGDIWDEVEIEDNEPVEYVESPDGDEVVDFSALPHGPAVLMPKPRVPKGNTKWYMRGEARQRVKDEAIGQGPPDDETWRDELHGNRRSKAVARLSDESHTHCSDSGFGLA